MVYKAFKWTLTEGKVDGVRKSGGHLPKRRWTTSERGGEKPKTEQFALYNELWSGAAQPKSALGWTLTEEEVDSFRRNPSLE